MVLPAVRACTALALSYQPRMDDVETKKRRLEARLGGGPATAAALPAAAAGASFALPSAAAAPPPAAPVLPTGTALFTALANEVLSFSLVTCAEELPGGSRPAPRFPPLFTHQVFREDETIFGYKDLTARSAEERRRLTLASSPARGFPNSRLSPHTSSDLHLSARADS